MLQIAIIPMVKDFLYKYYLTSVPSKSYTRLTIQNFYTQKNQPFTLNRRCENVTASTMVETQRPTDGY